MHIIEIYDRDRFLEITKHLIEENKLGRLDVDTLRKIRDVLLSFEMEYQDVVSSNGGKIIKKEFKNRIPL